VPACVSSMSVLSVYQIIASFVEVLQVQKPLRRKLPHVLLPSRLSQFLVASLTLRASTSYVLCKLIQLDSKAS
jgi:hypothetical protein